MDGVEHKSVASWQDPNKTAAATNSLRKAFGSDDNIVKVDDAGKLYEVPNTGKERGAMQKMWSFLKGDGWK